MVVTGPALERRDGHYLYRLAEPTTAIVAPKGHLEVANQLWMARKGAPIDRQDMSNSRHEASLSVRMRALRLNCLLKVSRSGKHSCSGGGGLGRRQSREVLG